MAEFTKAYKKVELKPIIDIDDEWVVIKNFPNYVINRKGKIFNTSTNKFLKYGINNGYYDVTLTKNKRHFRVKIHRIIAETFIDNIDNKPYIDHIDGDKLNNDINNLRWVTPYENNHNYITRKTHVSAIVNYNKINKSRKIESIDSNGNIKVYNSISEAAKVVNGDTGTISTICSNKIKYSKGHPYRQVLHKGYKWRYLYG